MPALVASWQPEPAPKTLHRVLTEQWPCHAATTTQLLSTLLKQHNPSPEPMGTAAAGSAAQRRSAHIFLPKQPALLHMIMPQQRSLQLCSSRSQALPHHQPVLITVQHGTRPAAQHLSKQRPCSGHLCSQACTSLTLPSPSTMPVLEHTTTALHQHHRNGTRTHSRAHIPFHTSHLTHPVITLLTLVGCPHPPHQLQLCLSLLAIRLYTTRPNTWQAAVGRNSA
jgi:hypothetical protein